jgi:hypothetical protein
MVNGMERGMAGVGAHELAAKFTTVGATAAITGESFSATGLVV